MEHGTFRLVLQNEAEKNPNTVSLRYVLATKHGDGGRIVYKARLLLRGHGERDKKSIVHHS